jgi:endonuclease/exonuclease/phosphatase family metal-dependent hydrolase
MNVTQMNLGRGADGITVMTMNVYVGADVDRILAAETREQIPILVAETFQELFFTNFSLRAEAIADQIQFLRPHLIGLQEISVIRTQTPGDFFIGNPVPAEDEVFNYLVILMNALVARGLDYQVAGIVQNFDIETPMLTSPPPDLAFDDVRLTDFDVVLARGDVVISNVVEANYAQALDLSTLGIELPRGYVAVDARIKENHTYRFVATHLEDSDLDVQIAQAVELIDMLKGETKPVIVVGDLNTPAPTGETYQLFEAAGYVDAWTRNLRRGEGDGFTFGHDPDLVNADSELTDRIDLILVRNNTRGHPVVGAVFATVWGDEPADRIPVVDSSFLWPSDHAAVIAEMRIPVLGKKAYAKK